MADQHTDCTQSPQAASQESCPVSKHDFVLQQGVGDVAPPASPGTYAALVCQPRIVAFALLIGVLTQSALLFLILGAALLWSALLPALNPFDAVYNRTLGAVSGRPMLSSAPQPRRFAQALAGALATSIAIFLFTDNLATAYTIEALFGTAVAVLSFGRFCLGSFLYHVLHGSVGFALRTLPWVHGA